MRKVFSTTVLALIVCMMLTVVTNAGDRVLQLYDKGSQVLSLQKQLHAKGYLEANDCDGSFNARTDRAVRDFQKYNSLEVTGMVDEDTKKLLFSGVDVSSTKPAATAKPTVTPKPSEAPFNSLKSGAQGAEVTKIQRKLIALGYLGEFDATGFYGTDTVEAVKAFQKYNGMNPDGICGKKTYDAILASNKKIPTPTKKAESSNNSGSLREGDSGNAVIQVQKMLISRGYMQGDATGYYGSATVNAVKKFQKAKGLKADGVCGTKTLALLNAKETTTTTNKKVDLAKSGTLRLGDKNDYVTELQRKLKEKGFFKGDLTGSYGESTRSAVINFQRANGITADGVAGSQTLKLIAGVTVAASTDWRVDIKGVELTEKQKNDVYWIARLIFAESRGQPYKGKVAVGSVVMNRLKKHGGTVYSIIFANSNGVYQFTPARTGKIYNTPTQECINAATEAYLGAKPAKDARYFINVSRSPNSWVAKNCTVVCKIGDHTFFK